SLLGEQIPDCSRRRDHEIAGGTSASLGGAKIVRRQNRDPANRRWERSNNWRRAGHREQRTDKSDSTDQCSSFAHIGIFFFRLSEKFYLHTPTIENADASFCPRVPKRNSSSIVRRRL